MKSHTPDWVRLGNAALAARDGLRATAGDFNELQKAIGADPATLAALDRVRGSVLAAVNVLRVALKDREGNHHAD